jgi:hypothetical protein
MVGGSRASVTDPGRCWTRAYCLWAFHGSLADTQDWLGSEMSARFSLYVPVAVLTLRNLPVIVYVTLMLPLVNEAVRENAPLFTGIGVWIVVLARNGAVGGVVTHVKCSCLLAKSLTLAGWPLVTGAHLGALLPPLRRPPLSPSQWTADPITPRTRMPQFNPV